MSVQPDLHIRYGPGRGIELIFFGLLIGLYGFLVCRPLAANNVLPFVPPLIGFGFLLYGVVRLFDRSVKLSLTSEGLKDHRTGTFIPWADFRGVRVQAAERSFDGTLYVSVSHKNGEREVEVDVSGLDRHPGEIAQFIQKWAKAAFPQQGAHEMGRGYTIELHPHSGERKGNVQEEST
jgi:hypothetical protein